MCVGALLSDVLELLPPWGFPVGVQRASGNNQYRSLLNRKFIAIVAHTLFEDILAKQRWNNSSAFNDAQSFAIHECLLSNLFQLLGQNYFGQ